MDASHWTAAQGSPLPPEISLLHMLWSVNLSSLYEIDQTSFFWNRSSSIRVHSLSVPTVVFHILLLKPGRVNQCNLKGINILSTCTEVYCLNIQSGTVAIQC